jgi:hypothetical protein
MKRKDPGSAATKGGCDPVLAAFAPRRKRTCAAAGPDAASVRRQIFQQEI